MKQVTNEHELRGLMKELREQKPETVTLECPVSLTNPTTLRKRVLHAGYRVKTKTIEINGAAAYRFVLRRADKAPKRGMQGAQIAEWLTNLPKDEFVPIDDCDFPRVNIRGVAKALALKIQILRDKVRAGEYIIVKSNVAAQP